MKKLLIPAIIAGSLFAYNLNLTTGWQMVGALEDINVKSFSSPDIKAVWAYDKIAKQWRAYLPNDQVDLSQYNIEPLKTIKKGEGFWVNSLADITVDVNNNKSFYDYLVDDVEDFTLEDVANKTFKVATSNGFVEIVFDENGKGVVNFKYATYDLWYKNGSVFAKNRDSNYTIESKKLALNRLRRTLKTLTDAEGLPNHYKAVKRRLD